MFTDVGFDFSMGTLEMVQTVRKSSRKHSAWCPLRFCAVISEGAQPGNSAGCDQMQVCVM